MDDRRYYDPSADAENLQPHDPLCCGIYPETTCAACQKIFGWDAMDITKAAAFLDQGLGGTISKKDIEAYFAASNKKTPTRFRATSLSRIRPAIRQIAERRQREERFQKNQRKGKQR